MDIKLNKVMFMHKPTPRFWARRFRIPQHQFENLFADGKMKSKTVIGLIRRITVYVILWSKGAILALGLYI